MFKNIEEPIDTVINKKVLNIPDGNNWLQSHVNIQSTTDFTIEINILTSDSILYSNILERQSLEINLFIEDIDYVILETKIIHGNVESIKWDVNTFNLNNPYLLAPLNDVICFPEKIFKSEKAVFTVVDFSYIDLLERMLYSFYLNSKCDNFDIYVFYFGDYEDFKYLETKYNLHLIKCESLKKNLYCKIKTVAYLAPFVIDSKYYLYLDADTLVLDNIQVLFDSYDVLSDEKILISKEVSFSGYTLKDGFVNMYCDYENMYNTYFSEHKDVFNTKFVLNNGVYLSKKKPLLKLCECMKNFLPESNLWDDIGRNNHIYWRERAIFNLAINKYDLANELSYLYNFTLHSKDATVDFVHSDISVTYENKPISILHFNGLGRNKYLGFQKYFSEQLKNFFVERKKSEIEQIIDEIKLHEEKDIKILLISEESPGLDEINWININLDVATIISGEEHKFYDYIIFTGDKITNILMVLFKKYISDNGFIILKEKSMTTRLTKQYKHTIIELNNKTYLKVPKKNS